MSYLNVVFMNLTKIHTRLAEYVVNFKKLLLDYAGISLLRQWKQTEKETIMPVEDSMLPEILRIQAEGFKHKNCEKIFKYSKNFRTIFYVIKSQDKVAGYCIYCLRPVISFKGFGKGSVINEIVIDRNFRGKGFAERLLKETIEEMKLNGILSILLYVNISNQSAIKLYEKIGFRKTKEVQNVCGQNETCYEMESKLV
jgi:[ribosomal protein S18]-alanine N-acetyltransferase